MLVDLVTVSLPHRSGLIKDNAVNGFVFAAEADIDVAGMTAIEAGLTEFYNTNVTSTSLAVANFISPCISRTVPPVFRHYNLDGHLNGTPHGSPVRTQNMALLGAASAGNPALPSEVAICMSFAADFGSDAEFSPAARPRARDRGRVFIGPLNSVCLSEDSADHRARVLGAAKDTIGHAGARLMLRGGTDPTNWVIWSRRNASVKQVTSVLVDDAFDTQRRRGEKAAIRTTYLLA